MYVTFTLRPARADELSRVGELTVGAYAVDGFLHGETGYAQELRDAGRRLAEAELVVAVDETGELMGCVTYCPEGSPFREVGGPGQGEFRMLATSPHARRRGVARALVQWCLDRSYADGNHALVLCSLDEMTSAHALYASMGFVPAPELDWQPAPGIQLLGFRRSL